MKILSQKRCIVGEGPIWNEIKDSLYYTNAYGKELCVYDFKTQDLKVRTLPFDAAAFAFDRKNNLLVSHSQGVHILGKDNSLIPIYDETRYQICFANDMKIGPDGAVYVGTQSGKRKGVSDKIDGKLYRISACGEVSVQLDGLTLSNGMEWSIDETKFYHTDTPTRLIKEYNFDKSTGEISFTGRQVRVDGVDGFTIGKDDCLYVSCWGQACIAVVDTKTMQVVKRIDVPCKIPSSCCFCGKNMDILAITTASKNLDVETDENAGFTFLYQSETRGRKPFLFGGK